MRLITKANKNKHWPSKESIPVYTFLEDWAKIIHLEGSTYFACGGSASRANLHWSQAIFSKKTFTFDVNTGVMKQKQEMFSRRQAHGLCRIGHYVYACGGLSSNTNIVKSCERYDLRKNWWYTDMPDLTEPKFSVTMIVVDHTWLYCFGGVGEYNPENITM